MFRGQITAAFHVFTFYRRKYSAHFTAVFCAFAFYRRNVATGFTAAFHNFVFYNRNAATGLTAVFRIFLLYSRNYLAIKGACFSSHIIYKCTLANDLEKYRLRHPSRAREQPKTDVARIGQYPLSIAIHIFWGKAVAKSRLLKHHKQKMCRKTGAQSANRMA